MFTIVSSRFRVAGFLIGVIFVSLIAFSQSSAATPFFVPAKAEWTTWEAEQAEAFGVWQAIADPNASGGQYLRGAKGAKLSYRFRVDRPVTLRVKPIWGRTGARRSAHLFPYPLPQSYGPTVLEACGRFVYALAPATGRIIVLDPSSEKFANVLEIGGYLTDLRADPMAQCLYASDAMKDRIVIVEAQKGQIIGELRTRRQPWALALVNDELYVACRAARCVQIFDRKTFQLKHFIRLDAEPIHLEPIGLPPSQIIIRFQQQAIAPGSLSVLPADEQQYGVRQSRTILSISRERKLEAIPNKPVLRYTQSGQTKELDLTAMAAGSARTFPPPTGFPDNAGVGGIVQCGSQFAYFTLPRAGAIGVMDLQNERLVKSIFVGGWLTDIVAYPRSQRIYVADATNSRLVLIDTDKLEIVGDIKTPSEPMTLELAENYQLQRPYLVPPEPINTLFVVCPQSRTVLAVDVTTNQPRGRLELRYQPRSARLVPPPNSDWWPLLASDRIAFAMQPRVAIEPMPQMLNMMSGELTAAPLSAEKAPTRTEIKWKDEAGEKVVRVPTSLLVQIGDKTKIDVTELCDPQLQPQRSLDPDDDTLGSVTLRLDEGPIYDWRRNIWSRPDDNLFLVYDTDEYWRWNAPAFGLKPGLHTLTLQAQEGDVHLDAVQIMPTADEAFDIRVRPEPAEIHALVPGYSYQGVFYDKEPVAFSIFVNNYTRQTQAVTVALELTDYMGNRKPLPPLQAVAPAQKFVRLPLTLTEVPFGRNTLSLRLLSSRGELHKEVHFVRLPKLVHPRLMFRAEDIPAIQERLQQYPRLFARYVDWLQRHSAKEGNWPERFLPSGLTAAGMAKAAPPSSKNPSQEWGWRMYEPAFRMLAVQFASRYIPGAEQDTLDARLKPLLTAPATDTWCQYHHHGPFFPGAVEALVDMAPEQQRKNLPLTEFMAKRKGDINMLPFTLMSFEEPLSPADRAMIYEIAVMQWNFERYFETHQGIRGGLWWQNPWSWCYCPTQGIFLGFLFTKNFFGEERLFEKPLFRGYLTFMEFADPIQDKAKLLPARRRPSGEPWRWILTAVARHPLEKQEYGWDEWLAKMNGELPQPEQQAVDDLMFLKGMPLAGPLSAAPHHFNTAVAVPFALALGWYDPEAPTVKWEELPPSVLFEKDGWAMLRSGWDAEATEIMFMSGIRDHTTRHQPNNLLLVRGGYFLLGTPSTWGDDGNCIPAWGNTVVAGERWLPRWQLNLHAAQSLERALIDRFTAINWAYIARDRALSGYAPAEGGFGGGIDLHGHTETILKDEGRIIAYETRPEYDYVAGEAAGAWPVEELRSHTRQLVFIKPHVVVIYDRVVLGPASHSSRWLACTGPELTITDNRFVIKNEEQTAFGQALLPQKASLREVAVRPAGFAWGKQKLLEIAPSNEASTQEYLVVLTVGPAASLQPVTAQLAENADNVAVMLQIQGQAWLVRFQRQGPVGGAVRPPTAKAEIALPVNINDTYSFWKDDPRYEKWIREPRFAFIIPPWDRK